MALLSYALTSVEKVKSSLGITSSNTDTLIEQLINAATQAIEAATHRRFKLTKHTEEIYSGNGDQNLILNNFPILTSGDEGTPTPEDVIVNFIYSDNTQEVIDAGDYRVIKSHGVLLRPYGWKKGDYNYSVTYYAGFKEIPFDIEQACIDIVGLSYNTRKIGGLKSEQIGNYSVTYQDAKSSIQQSLSASQIAQSAIQNYTTPEV